MTRSAYLFTTCVTDEIIMGKYTGRRLSPTHDEIAWLAFTLYEARGRQDGHDVEDWLRAEQQLLWRYA